MRKFYILLIIFSILLIVPIKLNAAETILDGHFWQKLSPSEKIVYVTAYVKKALVN